MSAGLRQFVSFFSWPIFLQCSKERKGVASDVEEVIW